MPNIAIVWDFDQTLTVEDSTSKVVDIILGEEDSHREFWDFIKSLRGDQNQPSWEHILASDAPIWMYALSRFAFDKGIPLNSEFFKEVVAPEIKLFPNVLNFLRSIKNLENSPDFKKQKLQIHHFIVSAGLKELVEEVIPADLITKVFGCRYAVIVNEGYEEEKPESVPVFCMDETMKTRSMFEISKGSFLDPDKPVNKRVENKELWAPFCNFIYIGDGPTDVPALSLTRYHGGLGVAVYNPDKTEEEVKERLANMSLDKRADLITAANFSLNGDLYKYLETRCIQIKQRCEAENLAT